MDTHQNRRVNADGSQQSKASSKQTQKKKTTAAEKKHSTKLKSQKSVDGVGKTVNESKGSADVKFSNSTKEECKENDPSKKQGKRKGKKASKTVKGIESSLEDSARTARINDAGSKDLKKQKKAAVSDLSASQGSRFKLDVLQTQQSKRSDSVISTLDCTQKASFELSRAKKRRNRKKRVLEALGISVDNKVKPNRAQKTRKRKSNIIQTNVSESTPEESDTPTQFEKSVTIKESTLTFAEKNESDVSKSKTHLNSRTPPLQLLRSSKDAFEGPQVEQGLSDSVSLITGQGKSVIGTENSKQTDDCLSGHGCNSVKRLDSFDLPLSENNSLLEVLPQTLIRKEDSVSSERINITNFLSHDNVQGLFRSALLSDITVSSRCSEKEVKNFFNTYGTFSEQNRSQFAAVEKLLLSNENTERDSTTSNIFDSEKSFDSDIALKSAGVNLASISKLDSNATESIENVPLISSTKSINSDIQSDERDSVLLKNNVDVGISCNSVGKSGNSAELTQNISLISGTFIRAPIYTSPNLENKVTNSVNSNQISSDSGNKNAVPFDLKFTNNCGCVVSEQEKSKSRVVEIAEDILPIEKESHEKLSPEREQDIASTFSNDLIISNQKFVVESEEIVKHKLTSSNICYLKKELAEQLISKSEPDISHNTVKYCPVTSGDCSKPDDNLNCKLENWLPLEEGSICDIPKSNTMHKTEKSREEVKAEREAKKTAKLSKKLKSSAASSQNTDTKLAPPVSTVSKDKKEPGVASVTSIKSDSPTDTHSRSVTAVLRDAHSPGTAAVPQRSHPSGAGAAPRDSHLPGPPRDASSPGAATGPRKKNQNLMSGDTNTATEKQKLKSVNNVEVKPTEGVATIKANSKGHVEVALTGTEVKSKAELRAERRAKQEAQRAAKAAAAPQPAAAPSEPQVKSTEEVSRKVTRAVKVVGPGKPVLQHKVKLFNHLYHKQEASNTVHMLNDPQLHPAIIRLGVQYAAKVVIGSNARCVALLNAVKQVIEDYKTPPQKEFSRGLESSLQPCTTFLHKCRPLSVSMTNALRHLKWQMRHLPNTVSDAEAKKKLQEAIDTYIREQIEVAGQAICNTVLTKISSGDVILTYGCSSLLQRILIKAHENGTKFRVVVVDGRPWREGKEMLRRLVESGLHCSYVLIPATSFIMREVTKVFLGAHALLANGYVMSRAGSSQVALLAHSYNVPVLVCCETHKFCERVQTDSFVYNELGDPDDLVETNSCVKERPLFKWRAISNLTPLNLTYDVTPPDLVTAVVTELAILPCTSVPVILRIKPTETSC